MIRPTSSPRPQERDYPDRDGPRRRAWCDLARKSPLKGWHSKSGTTAIVARQRLKLSRSSQSARRRSVSRCCGKALSGDAYKASHGLWACRPKRERSIWPLPALQGRHQIDNAGSALRGSLASGISLDEELSRPASPTPLGPHGYSR